MIGVVLWSDISDRKAVIWCEDQGDLAFLNAQDDTWETPDFFDAGDVVQFDVEVKGTMRRAHNPRLVEERVGAGLPDVLRNSANSQQGELPTAQIIPFVRPVSEKQVEMPRVSKA